MAFANAASQTVADFQVPRLNSTVLISTSIPFARAPALTVRDPLSGRLAVQVVAEPLKDASVIVDLLRLIAEAVIHASRRSDLNPHASCPIPTFEPPFHSEAPNPLRSASLRCPS